MLNIIKPGTKYDFLEKAPVFSKVSIALFVISLVIIVVKGLNLGLDFAGGHEILVQFDKKIDSTTMRNQLAKAFPGVDTSVQSFEVLDAPTKTFYLARIERSEAFGKKEIKELNAAFKGKYAKNFNRLRYNPEAGDRVEVEFTEGSTSAVDLSAGTLKGLVESTKHMVREVKQIGRPNPPRFSIALKGVDNTVLNAMKELDPAAANARVEFVGPTVGKQLRDDGLLAVLYALICILIYVALRFDFYYSPGAILCLFHDAIITTAILSLIGEEFSLATIAGLLTLVGYSINDTIVVFDRIRETAGKVKGAALKDVLNRAINETLGRTIMTSLSTLLACLCLLFFGRGTVLASFGMIMTVGILIGTYSSIYVASPAFQFLRERFGPKEVAPERSGKSGGAKRATV